MIKDANELRKASSNVSNLTHYSRVKGNSITGKFWSLLVIILSMTLANSSLASRLPLQAQLDKHLLAAQMHLEQSNYEKMQGQLDSIQALNVELPAIYFFYQARVYQATNEFDKATAAFEDYVLKAGAEGPHYQEALLALNTLELQKESQNNDSSGAKPEIEWEKSASSADQKHMQALKTTYSKTSEQDALVEHINTLLLSSGQSSGDVYKISLNKKDLTIQKQNSGGTAGTQITSRSIPAFGIAPEFTHDCQAFSNSCRILHRATADVWCTIANDEAAAVEIAKNLSLLITNLSKNP